MNCEVYNRPFRTVSFIMIFCPKPSASIKIWPLQSHFFLFPTHRPSLGSRVSTIRPALLSRLLRLHPPRIKCYRPGSVVRKFHKFSQSNHQKPLGGRFSHCYHFRERGTGPEGLSDFPNVNSGSEAPSQAGGAPSVGANPAQRRTSGHFPAPPRAPLTESLSQAPEGTLHRPGWFSPFLRQRLRVRSTLVSQTRGGHPEVLGRRVQRPSPAGQGGNVPPRARVWWGGGAAPRETCRERRSRDGEEAPARPARELILFKGEVLVPLWV